jgi:hypothetical protein
MTLTVIHGFLLSVRKFFQRIVINEWRKMKGSALFRRSDQSLQQPFKDSIFLLFPLIFLAIDYKVSLLFYLASTSESIPPQGFHLLPFTGGKSGESQKENLFINASAHQHLPT